MMHNADAPLRTLPDALWFEVLRHLDEESLGRLACVERWFAALVADERKHVQPPLCKTMCKSLHPLMCCAQCLRLVTETSYLHALDCGHLACKTCICAESGKTQSNVACAACAACAACDIETKITNNVQVRGVAVFPYIFRTIWDKTQLTA